MNNEEVAIEFVRGNLSQGDGSNFYFRGDILYSYGSHYILAKRIAPNEYLINADRYSVTTAMHHNHLSYAIGNAITWSLSDCAPENIHTQVQDLIWKRLEQLATSRGNTASYTADIGRYIAYYKKVCKRFKLRPNYTKLFRDCNKKTIQRMRDKVGYQGKSAYKLFRTWATFYNVHEKLMQR